MEISDFNALAELIPHISTTRKYWLVRTQGGLYYEDFRSENFIAVGYNNIRLEDIVDAKKKVPTHPENYLAEIIKARIADEKQPKYSAKQLLKFVYDIKEGDIVLIPSANSKSISIGEVTSSVVALSTEAPYVAPVKGQHKKCPFIKRKPVKWLKEVRRAQLDPLLYKLLFSHHFISDGSAYENIIDSMLHDFYIKGKSTYLILDVATKKDIEARVFFDTGSSLLNLVDGFAQQYGVDLDSSGVDVKINLRSPGKIELKSRTFGAALIMGLLVVGVNGGGFTYEGGGLKINTDGLIKNLIHYQNDAHKRAMQEKILNENIKKLNVKSPDDFKKLMDALKIEENNSENPNVE